MFNLFHSILIICVIGVIQYIKYIEDKNENLLIILYIELHKLHIIRKLLNKE